MKNGPNPGLWRPGAGFSAFRADFWGGRKIGEFAAVSRPAQNRRKWRKRRAGAANGGKPGQILMGSAAQAGSVGTFWSPKEVRRSPSMYLARSPPKGAADLKATASAADPYKSC